MCRDWDSQLLCRCIHAWHCLTWHAVGLHPFTASPLQVVGGDWYTPLQEWQGQLSGVLSNPPYINSEQLPSLQVAPAPGR